MAEKTELVQLRRIMTRRFSDSDLRDLCFDLGIQYEDLPGSTRKDKIRELILYCDRYGQLDQLAGAVLTQPEIEKAAKPLPSRRSLQRYLAQFWMPAVLLVGLLGLVLIRVWPIPAPDETPTLPAISPTADARPDLPATAPLLPTTIAIATFTDCTGVTPLSEELAEELTDLYRRLEPPAVSVLTLPEVTDSATVRMQGEEAKADLFVWGLCNRDDLVIHFEILSNRGTPEVFEPPTVSLTNATPDQIARVGYELGIYQRRDYRAAAVGFDAANRSDFDVTIQAFLHLMSGNSYLFNHQYPEAVDSFEAAINLQPGWTAAYNNLGVAQSNASWYTAEFDQALATLTDVLEQDESFALAHLNTVHILLYLGYLRDGEPDLFQQAEESCRAAARSPGELIQAMAHVCFADVQVARYYYDDNLSLLNPDATHVSELAALKTYPYWSAPHLAQANVYFSLYRSNNDSFSLRRAEESLSRYLEAALDDVHLEHSLNNYTLAQYSLDQIRRIE